MSVGCFIRSSRKNANYSRWLYSMAFAIDEGYFRLEFLLLVVILTLFCEEIKNSNFEADAHSTISIKNTVKVKLMYHDFQ
jgi:hypothetical protein